MRNKSRLCLSLIIFLVIPSKIFSSVVEEKQLRDSTFKVAYSLSGDSLRSGYLRNVFQRNLGKQWVTELLDSALSISTRERIPSEIVAACYDYFRHYQFQGDTENMEHWFNILKKYSYLYKNFDHYFNAWNAQLQFRSARGDTGYVIIEVNRMKKEAKQTNYKNGEYVAQITLAQSYYFSGNGEGAIDIYQELIKHPELRAREKILIYSQLFNIRIGKGDYNHALKELKCQQEVINQLIRENPENRYLHKSHLLDIELSFCRIYLELEDKEALKRHLEKAKEFYTDDCFFSYYISYHVNRGGYYYLVKKWDKCFKEFDIALNHFEGKQPIYENFVRKMKAQTVMASGDIKGSAEIYKQVALKWDSLNTEVLHRHEEIQQANYKIQKALFDKEENIKQFRLTAIAAASLILIAFIFVIVRAFFIQRQLRHSEQQIRKTLATVIAADKMKELFLQNITYEIRIPLNAVVGLSDLLSTEKDLSPDEIQDYSDIIKNNSGKLLLLINNVLDLSRLEAGMMRFNLQQCDAVQLCREAKMMIEMQDNNPVHITFRTEPESLQIEADSSWFLKLLSSVLSAPNGYNKPCEVTYTLKKEHKNLQITVVGSPLSQWSGDEQGQRIQHEINQLYLETFKGSYQILKREEQEIIVITYPLS